MCCCFGNNILSWRVLYAMRKDWRQPTPPPPPPPSRSGTQATGNWKKATTTYTSHIIHHIPHVQAAQNRRRITDSMYSTRTLWLCFESACACVVVVVVLWRHRLSTTTTDIIIISSGAWDLFTLRHYTRPDPSSSPPWWSYRRIPPVLLLLLLLQYRLRSRWS